MKTVKESMAESLTPPVQCQQFLLKIVKESTAESFAPLSMKIQVYKAVIFTTLLYYAETWVLHRKQFRPVSSTLLALHLGI